MTPVSFLIAPPIMMEEQFILTYSTHSQAPQTPSKPAVPGREELFTPTIQTLSLALYQITYQTMLSFWETMKEALEPAFCSTKHLHFLLILTLSTQIALTMKGVASSQITVIKSKFPHVLFRTTQAK